MMGAAMLLSAVLFRILDLDWFAGFSLVMLMPFMFFGIGIASVVLVYQNFNRNLLSNEGYFMLTLPVKRYKFIISKLLTSIMWFNFMLGIGFITALILIDRSIFTGISMHSMFFVTSFTTVFVLNIFAINAILALYLLAVASNVSFNGKKFGWWLGAIAFGAFVIIEVLFISRIANPLFDGLAIWFYDIGDGIRMTVSSGWPLEGIQTSGFVMTSNIDAASTLSMILFSVLAYCIIAFYLKKRVDLQ